MNNTGYATHILNTGHSNGPTEDAMDIIKLTNKGPIMDTVEKYHIYVANDNRTELNDTHIHNRNPIFDTLCKFQQHTNHTHPQPLPLGRHQNARNLHQLNHVLQPQNL
jgi:hypothetical protein